MQINITELIEKLISLRDLDTFSINEIENEDLLNCLLRNEYIFQITEKVLSVSKSPELEIVARVEIEGNPLIRQLHGSTIKEVLYNYLFPLYSNNNVFLTSAESKRIHLKDERFIDLIHTDNECLGTPLGVGIEICKFCGLDIPVERIGDPYSGMGNIYDSLTRIAEEYDV